MFWYDFNKDVEKDINENLECLALTISALKDFNTPSVFINKISLKLFNERLDFINDMSKTNYFDIIKEFNNIKKRCEKTIKTIKSFDDFKVHPKLIYNIIYRILDAKNFKKFYKKDFEPSSIKYYLEDIAIKYNKIIDSFSSQMISLKNLYDPEFITINPKSPEKCNIKLYDNNLKLEITQNYLYELTDCFYRELFYKSFKHYNKLAYNFKKYKETIECILKRVDSSLMKDSYTTNFCRYDKDSIDKENIYDELTMIVKRFLFSLVYDDVCLFVVKYQKLENEIKKAILETPALIINIFNTNKLGYMIINKEKTLEIEKRINEIPDKMFNIYLMNKDILSKHVNRFISAYARNKSISFNGINNMHYYPSLRIGKSTTSFVIDNYNEYLKILTAHYIIQKIKEDINNGVDISKKYGMNPTTFSTLLLSV